MTDVRISERKTALVAATIDSGAVVSEGVWLQGRPLLGLEVPAFTTAGTVNVEVSNDGGATFLDLLTAAGSQAVEVVVGTTGFFLSSEDLAPLAGYVGQYDEDDVWGRVLVRLVSHNTVTADREFNWLMVA